MKIDTCTARVSGGLVFPFGFGLIKHTGLGLTTAAFESSVESKVAVSSAAGIHSFTAILKQLSILR